MVDVNQFRNELLKGLEENADRADKGKAHARQILSPFIAFAETAKEVYPDRIKIGEPSSDGFAFQTSIEVDSYSIVFLTQPGYESVDVHGLQEELKRVIPQRDDRRSRLERNLRPQSLPVSVSPDYFDVAAQAFAQFLKLRLQSR